MPLKKSIRFLRVTALLLFIIPFAGLIGSLFFHNYLVSFNYTYEKINPIIDSKPGTTIELICNKKNDWCNFKKTIKLNQCSKNLISKEFFSEDRSEISYSEFLKKLKKKETHIIKYTKSEKLSKTCILNSNIYYLYQLFPNFFETRANGGFTLGTSKTVNPIVYGETSISNIVKRYPVKFVFKPLMFFSVFLMIIYWLFYNNVLNNIFQVKRMNVFLI